MKDVFKNEWVLECKPFWNDNKQLREYLLDLEFDYNLCKDMEFALGIKDALNIIQERINNNENN